MKASLNLEVTEGCTTCGDYIVCDACIVKQLGAGIEDNRELRRVVMDAKPAMRRQVYEQIKPYLKFKAKPFLLLTR